jgi:hypothetical protein
VTVVDLHDVKTILQVEKDIDEHHDPPLVNFEKWTRLKCQAMSIVERHYVPPLPYEDNLRAAMEYMKAALLRVSTEDNSNRVLPDEDAQPQRNDMVSSAGFS